MATHTKPRFPPTKYFVIALLIGVIYAMFVTNSRTERYLAIVSGKGMNLEELQQVIEREIPLGSSKFQIEKWGKKNKIQFGYLDGSKYDLSHEALTARSGISIKKLSGVLEAEILGSSGAIIQCHTRLFFFIDKNGKSIKQDMGGSCTNPYERIDF